LVSGFFLFSPLFLTPRIIREVRMFERFRSISGSHWFQRAAIAVIILSAVLVGIETNSVNHPEWRSSFVFFNDLIALFFVFEIVIRVGAYRPRPMAFFSNGWNVFDVALVTLCLVPFSQDYAAIGLLARALRLLRLVTLLPQLHLIVRALLHTIPAIGYVMLLLVLQFYVYATVGTFIFGANDPVHFGTLQMAIVSLFRVLTLEDWTDLMYIQMYGSDNYGYGEFTGFTTESAAFPIISILYFISFVVLGTMIILNLFVGVMINGITQTTRAAELNKLADKQDKGYLTVVDEVHLLSNHIDELKESLETLSVKLKRQERDTKVSGARDAVPQLRVINGGRQTA
jgi:voltage-gated sodium channel